MRGARERCAGTHAGDAPARSEERGPEHERSIDLPVGRRIALHGGCAADEARHSVELETMYIIQPAEASWFGYSWKDKGKPLPEGFTYTSDNNSEWLDIDGIKEFVAPFEKLFAEGKLEG